MNHPCEVCEKEEAIGTVASQLGPFSFAIGEQCMARSAEPLWACCAMLEVCCGEDNVREDIRNDLVAYDRKSGEYVGFKTIVALYKEDPRSTKAPQVLDPDRVVSAMGYRSPCVQSREQSENEWEAVMGKHNHTTGCAQLDEESWLYLYRRRIAQRGWVRFWWRFSWFWPEWVRVYPGPGDADKDYLCEDPVEHADEEISCWSDDEAKE